MLFCPNGHGEKNGRHCDECGASLVSPPTGDKVAIRSPEAHATASVSPLFVMPGGTVETRPAYVKCPQCGRRKLEPETFDCRGGCGRQNLCLDHFDKDYEVCGKCASALRGDAQAEAERQACLQAELAAWHRRGEQAEARVAELTQQGQKSQAALEQARQRGDALAQESAGWRGRAEKAETQGAALAAEARQAQVALAQARADQEEARRRMSALEQELAGWRQRAEQAEQKLAEIARKEADRQRIEADKRMAAEQTRLRQAEELRRKELALELAPGVTLELVRVPAGEFLMGSDKAIDPQAYDAELPQHRLTLPEILIGKYPVTVAQFAVFVKATGYKTTAEQRGSGWNWTGSVWKDIKGADWAHPRGPGSDVQAKTSHPVTLVSWDDAVAFARWASQVTGRPVRLPSEAEWEKAARGGDGRLYPWGNEPPDDRRCNFNMNVEDTTPVGKYSPLGDSPYDCADMAGNVWEWTGSLWGKDVKTPDFKYPYDPRAGREDLAAGADVARVLRGGSFDDDTQDVRCAYRDRHNPELRNDHAGFRVASPGL